MTFDPIQAAHATFDGSGVLRSTRFDDVYASSHGALEQAGHVFLGGNDLPARWRRQGARFTIVETGFGAGLNFMATWLAFRESAPPGARLHYVSVEKHPFVRADLARIHASVPQLADLSPALLDAYPPLIPGFHRIHLDGGRVTLTLLFGEAAAMLRELDASVDAFFLDGFAPAKNPGMWTPEIFAELARLAKPGATFATYTVAGSVCDGLRAAGFTIEKRRGFASKREMLCGHVDKPSSSAGATRERNAMVVGAGLAGTSIAQRLAVRGWDVQLIERHATPAQEASGNPAGLVRPVFSLDWNTHSRFTSAAFLYAMRHEACLERSGTGSTRGHGGVLQFARDPERFAKQQRMVQRFGLPSDLVQLLDAVAAADLAGVPVAGPASWFPEAFWANPASMCRANLTSAREAVNCTFGNEVATLRKVGSQWEALEKSGRVLARAPVVVLANAVAASRFPQSAWLPLRPVRGQITSMPARAGRNLRVAVSGDGYVTPAIDGRHCIGASFNEDLPDVDLRAEDHAANLQRLEWMLPGFGQGVNPSGLGGRVAFRAMSHDRLPILGEVGNARDEGLFACLALGSRGMTWGALAAEIVASRIDGDPMPVEKELLAALAPARFAKFRTG
ncbi:MAG TPA: bifunctional tRNA (5-methylaminomethyl-2-thiouridine)(34)-methyltransferase MnmD/FAD-dependent 5-carboxymethylaminomethyl-2-thiouridine(34) oxidoreductase MnmC [Burkholderiales bacterium]|nr:bifunctional tRNA (5-methylaminomethyl-2-thiouridine)(34)-methyltransferase MnmD/FAD-dependent 5-carboxymethylaminomethyl-2-thiouridine(34) oxidoreductase MnmC [Burkholderiales bacterium]